MNTPRPIGFWLKLVDRMIDDQFAATLEEHGVTRDQWQILNVLSRQTATREELDDAADAPATEHLVELVESTWVVDVSGSFELTERGSLAFERLAEVVANQRTVMTAGLSAEQYEATVSSLEQMAGNLGWSE